MKKVLPLLPALLLVIASCKQPPHKQEAVSNTCPKNAYLEQAVLWYQHSGEAQALYYQAYNAARYSLNNYLKSSKNKKKKAVIVDIDETLLNNSPFEGNAIRNNISYSLKAWTDWASKAEADSLPGACSFLRFAASKGVEVFYISNRPDDEIGVTLKNLRKFNFPNADSTHLLFMSNHHSKKDARRAQVAKDYDIALLCGDNLADFSNAFEVKTLSQVHDSVDKHWTDFGKRFIVLPNPMYGNWERMFYGKKKYDQAQKDSVREAGLIGF